MLFLNTGGALLAARNDRPTLKTVEWLSSWIRLTTLLLAAEASGTAGVFTYGYGNLASACYTHQHSDNRWSVRYPYQTRKGDLGLSRSLV